MSHNTFTIRQEEEWFYSDSHNFPEFIGRGRNETQAINDMNNQIGEYVTRDYEGFKKRIQDRINRGLECECGEKLTDEVVFVKGIKKEA